MVEQDESIVDTAVKSGRGLLHNREEGALYVLDILAQLQTVAEVAGCDELSDDLEDVLSRHMPSRYKS